MSELGLSYDRGELCLSYAGEPSDPRALEMPIRLVIAAAGARLG
jgi:hypothetical protein